MKLSIFEVMPKMGGWPGKSLHYLKDNVARVEKCGYHRILFPQYYYSHSSSCVPPDQLAMLCALHSEKIIVGSCGVLIRYNTPISIIERFKVLEALFPGRINLGFSNGSGDLILQPALEKEYGKISIADNVNKLERLHLFAECKFPAKDPRSKLRPFAAINLPRKYWVTGNIEKAVYFAKLGYGLISGWTKNSAESKNLLDAYTQASIEAGFKPDAILTVPVICAETNEQAEWLNDPNRKSVHDMAFQGRFIVGNSEYVQGILEEIAKESGHDELMIMSPLNDIATRFKSYELTIRGINAGS